MDEHASFETRAVLAPRRARRARLALLVPALAFVGVTWAGLSGNHSDPVTAQATGPAPATSQTTVATAPPTEAPYPTLVVGLVVRRLDDIQSGTHDRDYEFAVAGWYVPIAVSDCPPLAIVYRDGSLPEIRRDVDAQAYCVRSGILYATRPDPELGTKAGLPAVSVSVVKGVVVPPPLETVGSGPMQVIVLGRFVPSYEYCDVSPGCGPVLVVDHLAWTAGA